MKVLKFGGTSVGSPAAIRSVVAIVRAACDEGRAAVVVSAFGGVTNQLLAAAGAAAARDSRYETFWQELRERHLQAAGELAGDDAALVERIETLLGELHELLRGAYLLREASDRARDGIASYGERLSAEVVAAACRAAGLPARAVDTRQVIVTDSQFGKAAVDLELSEPRIRAAFDADGGVPIFTGFIGATPEGFTTTLGRGGSDYSGALVGAALGASAVEIWTDVDGVFTTDPRQVASAFSQPEMSYAELMELSHFGAKVVYPPSIHPARALGIPLWIKNTFRPEHPGTVVRAEVPPAETPIRGLSSIREVALARLEGDGMVGVPGIAGRLFGALARQAVSVILISQSSSEHTICFAVQAGDAEAARRAVDSEFTLERKLGLLDPLVVEPSQTVIAAVGAQMARRPGIAGRVFGVLGDHGVNVRAIAQGSSELNISLVIGQHDEARALSAMHDAFFGQARAAAARRVDVALLGAGRVGGALLDQLAERADALRADEGLDLRLVALAARRKLAADPAGLPWADARAALVSGAPYDATTLAATLLESRSRARVVVDCTADGALGELYPRLLESGIAVVAANKKSFTGSQASWQATWDAAGRGHAPLLFETTAGAGLPIVGTLRDLVRTGDRLLQLDGVLSGTNNSLCALLDQGLPFSQALRQAYDQGLTEPLPYEDLAGLDVARKLCILARLAGRRLELEDIEVEPLLPADPWSTLALDDFWRVLPEADEGFAARHQDAAGRGHRLRYLARLDADGARVTLAAVGPEHPAFTLQGPDNLVALRTERYNQSPLVVRGPGAGPAVTAAGVFADLLHAAAEVTR